MNRESEIVALFAHFAIHDLPLSFIKPVKTVSKQYRKSNKPLRYFPVSSTTYIKHRDENDELI